MNSVQNPALSRSETQEAWDATCVAPVFAIDPGRQTSDMNEIYQSVTIRYVDDRVWIGSESRRDSRVSGAPIRMNGRYASAPDAATLLAYIERWWGNADQYWGCPRYSHPYIGRAAAWLRDEDQSILKQNHIDSDGRIWPSGTRYVTIDSGNDGAPFQTVRILGARFRSVKMVVTFRIASLLEWAELGRATLWKHDAVAGVRYGWDDQPGVIPGWYAEYLDADDSLISDSMKIDSPVEVESFTRQQEKELVDAFIAAFPDAVIWTAKS